MGGRCSWICTGLVTTSLLPGFRKFRWSSRTTGYLGTGFGAGPKFTYFTYSSSSATLMFMSRKHSPKWSTFGCVQPTEITTIRLDCSSSHLLLLPHTYIHLHSDLLLQLSATCSWIGCRWGFLVVLMLLSSILMFVVFWPWRFLIDPQCTGHSYLSLQNKMSAKQHSFIKIETS